MKSGELFAGVGGLGMAVDEVFGAEPEWFAEFDEAPSKVLAHHHPDVPNLGDVTQVEAPPRVNVLAGGFPCQDVSLAGRRRGLKAGTRSGLWSEFARLIDAVRPDWVVIENVRGLLSADAAGDVEPCPWCLGDDGEQHALRALGAVLGDLCELGFDAEWTGLRAADVGAPHGRFRVFILAWPRERTTPNADGGVKQPSGTRPDQRRLPGSDGPGTGRDDVPLTLLPTPLTSDGTGGPKKIDGAEFAPQLREITQLLPTPVAQPSGNSPEEHLRKKPGREVVTDLSIIAENGLIATGGKLLPTPEAKNGTAGPDLARRGRDGSGGDDLTTAIWKEGLHDAASEGRPDQVLQGVRREADSEALREREARGSDDLPEEGALLTELREYEGSRSSGLTSLASEAVQASDDVRGVRAEPSSSARAPHRQEPREQPAGEPDNALPELPSQEALAGRSEVRQPRVEWGPYEPAIRRWEAILGRPAPDPVTHDGRGGKPRLNPALTEFMMGWPAGHVTDPAIGLTRAEQLKACGNGVVTQQAVAALREMLARPGVPALRAEAVAA